MINNKQASSAVIMTALLFLGTNSLVSAETVSTVDTKELFQKSKLVQDVAVDQSKIAADEAIEAISEQMADQKARLHWEAVPQKSVTVATNEVVEAKATPIIITAADIDAQKKAARKNNGQVINDNVTTGKVLPVVPVKPSTPVAPPQPSVTVNTPVDTPVVTPSNSTSVPNNTNTVEIRALERYSPDEKIISLPPVEPVPVASVPVTKAKATEIVELPAVTPVATNTKTDTVVELPAVVPVG